LPDFTIRLPGGHFFVTPAADKKRFWFIFMGSSPFINVRVNGAAATPAVWTANISPPQTMGNIKLKRLA